MDTVTPPNLDEYRTIIVCFDCFIKQKHSYCAIVFGHCATDVNGVGLFDQFLRRNLKHIGQIQLSIVSREKAVGSDHVEFGYIEQIAVDLQNFQSTAKSVFMACIQNL